MARKTKSTKALTKKPRAALAEQPPEQATEVRILLNQAQEIGTSGLKEVGGFVAEAYNPALYYPKAYTVYNKIRRSTPEIVTIRQAFTAWARNVSPIVELPDEPTDDDKRYQDFIQEDFDNLEGGFTNFIDTAVNHVPFFGFGWWDVAPCIRDPRWIPPPYKDAQGQTWADDWRSEYDDGNIGIRRISWRDIGTFIGWEFDGRKKVIGMKQQDYPNPPVTLPKSHGLHLTYGDPNVPEGLAGLEPVWRLERIKYGLEVIMGIGFEHAAGHLKVKKTEKGTLSNADKTLIRNAAKAILSGQEGNYAAFPFGMDGDVIDVPFAAAGNLLEAIKYYGIMILSIYMMQFVALNTMTNTGALASQVDSTQIGIFSFNGLLDGLAAQYDEQIGKRLWGWNKFNFPNATKRPKIKFSHIENNLAMGELGSFLRSIQGIIPLGEDDLVAFRKRSGWMPHTNPNPEDVIVDAQGNTAGDQPPVTENDNEGDPDAIDEANIDAESSDAKDVIEQALRFHSRSTRISV